MFLEMLAKNRDVKQSRAAMGYCYRAVLRILNDEECRRYLMAQTKDILEKKGIDLDTIVDKQWEMAQNPKTAANVRYNIYNDFKQALESKAENGDRPALINGAPQMLLQPSKEVKMERIEDAKAEDVIPDKTGTNGGG